MFCFIYKWLISRSLDKDIAISGLLGQHLRRCASCREYARFGESLRHRLAQDTPGILEKPRNALNKKIISALDTDKKPKKVRITRPFMLPALATSLLTLAIIIGVIFQISPFRSRTQSGSFLPPIDISTAPVENFLLAMESPYEQEFLDLKETVKSTTSFLLSRLDVNINRKVE